jgi:hypothetical protein
MTGTALVVRERPEYSKELADHFCRLIVQGMSFRHAAREIGLPHSTIWGWRADYPYFTEQYARAARARAHSFQEEILEIADDATNDWMERERKDGSVEVVVDHEHIARSRERIATRKWIMSKMLPKLYGERAGPAGDDGADQQDRPPDADVSPRELGRRVAFTLLEAAPDEAGAGQG